MADLAIPEITYPGATRITNQQELSQAYNGNRAVILCHTHMYAMEVCCPHGTLHPASALMKVIELYHRCPDAPPLPAEDAHLPVPSEEVAICNMDILSAAQKMAILEKMKGMAMQKCACSLSGRVRTDIKKAIDARKAVA